MTKRAIKLVITARKNIIKKRKMSFVTPPPSPDNRTDSEKVRALDKKRRDIRRANRLDHQNNHNNNLIPIVLDLNDNDDANNPPN
tara:strand:- start:68 stop:322 length:255 start_codon:yes stop_codon:yes gene_type:complete